jgi:hypothetical protein
MKYRNATQDALLDTVFHAYMKANDSAADIRTMGMVNSFSDSADRYTSLAKEYLFNKQLDSCIRAIHIANYYIVNTQVLLHLKPEDQYQHSRPNY